MEGWMDGQTTDVQTDLQILFPKTSKLYHIKYLASAIQLRADP